MEKINEKNIIVTGEKIYLRPIKLSDVNKNYLCWMQNKEVTKYLESRFFPQSIKIIKEYIKSVISNPQTIFFAIIAKEEQKHIGNVKLHRINQIHRFGEISIIIGDKFFWGRGYGADALKTMVKYSFEKLELHKLIANVYSINKASIRAFEKAGFKKEGVLKQHCLSENKYIDIVMLGIINEIYSESHK